MPGYAIGHLRNVRFNEEIVEYLERIDATLEPFGGEFLIHGAREECMEGNWVGDLIVIAFPSLGDARDWYFSPAYQEIAPLRSRNADGEILLIDGLEGRHRATDVLKTVAQAG
jgi:uncharacterized protein (DUF1330 family)